MCLVDGEAFGRSFGGMYFDDPQAVRAEEKIAL
jgi:hypothetical protein